MTYQNATEVTLAALRKAVPELKVVSVVPNPRPRIFVRSWRTGGSAINRVLDAPIITTQVWGTDAADEAELEPIANRLRDAVYGNVGGLIRSSRRVEEVTGLYFDPDPASSAPRYTFAWRPYLRAKF